MKNQNKFGLYIHWPFCIKKCPYCDFNSYVMSNNSLDWVNYLITEIKLYSNLLKDYKIETIFFGGGTPSLIPPKYIKLILDEINDIWPIPINTEITLETNPSSIETHNLEQFMQNGINRFSIGVQSLKDENLKFLGRTHNAKEAIEIVTQASKICNNISCDFIYTLPHDTLASWKKDLDEIINLLSVLNINHCSLYQLTIEPNTGFFNDVKHKKWEPMNDTNQSILYRYTYKKFNQIRWNQYEISNFCKTQNFECQHNLIYWNYKQYLGIGAGAHSRIILNNQKHSWNNIKNPLQWQEKVNSLNENFPYTFVQDFTQLTKKEQFIEKLLMGLRLTKGIIIEKEEFDYIDTEMLNLLIKKKFIKQNNNHYSLSLNGKIRLNAVLREILL